ncbi:hypothetical protein F5B22DRAFT_171633 [Xylaria bambusicola]|uniref:uncharacterized protein n=1 Tax=Xylaria bambusicola TaxID=326684 RepID=UPI002007505C|nr:uncharacterized protein F5B22DRAFT_171633 [Xylaria bambusicola]KAI0526685.1 hypothetical protein F5B22DRAFT_171633 [Xylaria bambusicola]
MITYSRANESLTCGFPRLYLIFTLSFIFRSASCLRGSVSPHISNIYSFQHCRDVGHALPGHLRGFRYEFQPVRRRLPQNTHPISVLRVLDMRALPQSISCCLCFRLFRHLPTLLTTEISSSTTSMSSVAFLPDVLPTLRRLASSTKCH